MFATLLFLLLVVLLVSGGIGGGFGVEFPLKVMDPLLKLLRLLTFLYKVVVEDLLPTVRRVLHQLLIVLRYIESYLGQVFLHLRKVLKQTFWCRYLRIYLELLLPIVLFIIVRFFLLGLDSLHAPISRLSPFSFFEVGIYLQYPFLLPNLVDVLPRGHILLVVEDALGPDAQYGLVVARRPIVLGVLVVPAVELQGDIAAAVRAVDERAARVLCAWLVVLTFAIAISHIVLCVLCTICACSFWIGYILLGFI